MRGHRAESCRFSFSDSWWLTTPGFLFWRFQMKNEVRRISRGLFEMPLVPLWCLQHEIVVVVVVVVLLLLDTITGGGLESHLALSILRMNKFEQSKRRQSRTNPIFPRFYASFRVLSAFSLIPFVEVFKIRN